MILTSYGVSLKDQIIQQIVAESVGATTMEPLQVLVQILYVCMFILMQIKIGIAKKVVLFRIILI